MQDKPANRLGTHRSTESQLGNGIDGDRSRSFTILGANSPHSTPTLSPTFRDTYAVITSARCERDGILILTSTRELSRRSTSAFMSAPLKLRFFMQPSAHAKVSADTWTGILALTRSPQRLSFPCHLCAMIHISFV